MTLKKCFAATMAIALSCGCAFAIPAKRGVMTVTQPDGTTINIMKTGDEFMHFTTTEDGYLLRQDADGFYRIAKVENDGAIISTGHLPSRANLADFGTKLSSINKEDLATKRLAGNKRRAPQTGLGRSESSYPTTGRPKGLILLVEYSDVKFTTKAGYNPYDYFYDMINGANFTQFGGTGSALKYFQDQSGNKFSPEFEVLGPVTLPNRQSYYGGNDRYGNDMHPEEMVIDGIKKLDPYTDFSEFDTDGDGVIDNVFVFYAGQGEADYGNANTVWPHSWDVRYGGQNVEVDGVLIGHYACSNEWEVSQPCGVGTFIHEFSHVMGLPDLYHTTDYVYYTPGEYSVLDYGPYNNNGRTPPNYGAYEKNAMGWFEPIMIDGPATVTLENITSGEFGLVATSNKNEFFLFENRQQKDWDKYIPGHGMLIWHIDYNKNAFDRNVVNNTESHQYVDIVEANNQPNYERFAAGFTFPGTSKKDSFTASTTPAFKEWSGKAIDLPITNIMESNGIISFDVAGGASVSAPVPTVKEYSRDNMFFTIEWEPVSGAKDYTLSVYVPGGDASTIKNGFDGSNVGDWWQATSTNWIDSYDRIGESAPSFAFQSNNVTLTSPETSEDITGIKFWAMGASGVGPTLKVEGLSDGEWLPIYEFQPKDLYEEETIEIESGIPSGVRQIRFVMNKPLGLTGWILLDDIVISYGEGDEVLPDYDNVSVGKSTEIKVDKLKAGTYEYYFTVSASDGTITRTSEPIEVVLDGEYKGASVGLSPSEETMPVYYNLQGIRIEKPEPGSIVIEAKGKTTRKIKL